MKLVFADAFYFVARLNRRDQHHAKVLEFTRSFQSQILTSDFILLEVADALAASESRSHMKEFIFHLRGISSCEIVPASRELLGRALDLYHQHTDKGWTLTDCISFIIMRERNISEALTADRHFEQAGFVALLK